MIKIAICDDEQRFRKQMVKCCQRYMEEKEREYQIREYASGEEFLLGEYPDILLLDITMKRISGLIVRDILTKTHSETRILFVAENRNYMSQAFGKNVYGFLLKPIHYDMLCEKMDEMLEDMASGMQYVYCKKEGEIQRVYLKSILYIQSHHRYTKVYIHGIQGYLLSEKGIREWCTLLPTSEYTQCNKSQIVHLRYVTRVQDDVELIDGIHLRLTQRYYEEFCERYKRWGEKI